MNMKEFILRARKAKTNPGIDLNHLPKEGKMDAVCATISNALWVSGDIRKDTIMHVVLEGPSNGPRMITFTGSEMKGMWSDERSIAGYIISALQRGTFLQLNEEAHVRKGIHIAKKSFERLVWEKSNQYKQVIFLDKDGKDIREFPFMKDFVVVFGAPEGLPPKTIKLIKDINAAKISLGPRMLFSAHCPILVHNELDRRGM